MDIAGFVYSASTWVIPVLIAITFHEAAHAFAAWRLGDDTAYRMGRMTFNPLKHVDPFGTVMLPALLLVLQAPFLFGWAKPVPVNFAKLRNPRGHMVLVAAAGPAINLGLATVSAVLIRLLWVLPDAFLQWTGEMLFKSILLNVVLAVFNLIPLPPLDGGRIAVGLLPDFLAHPLARLERYGMLILIGIVFILPMLGRQAGVDLNIFRWIIWTPVSRLLPIFQAIAGLG